MTYLSFARAELPLIDGMDQTGYIARFGGATGVLDRPELKVLLLKEGFEKPAVLVFCDLLGFSPERTKLYERRAAQLCGTVPERVAITCTHSHAAPSSMSLIRLGECRDSWFSRFEQVFDRALTEAHRATPEDVRVFFGKTLVEGVARNRVQENALVDTDETLLLFKTRTRSIALVNYACHPVTLSAENRLYSADYPGAVRRILERSGLVDEAIFATAPCGDLNPVEQDEPGECRRLEEYALRIAQGAKELLASDSLMELSGFSMEKKAVRFPLAADHGRADISGAKIRAKRLYDSSDDKNRRKYAEANYLYALSHEKLLSLGLTETHFDAVLTKIRFGNFTIIGVPFELFSGIGVELKERLAPACVMELCGGNFGYFPSEQLYDAANYERGDAYMYYNRGGPLEKTAERTLMSALLED